MKNFARTIAELLLFGLLAGVLLVAVIAGAQQIFDDEKTQCFVIGYYVAIHNNLVPWIWKRLGVERKAPPPA